MKRKIFILILSFLLFQPLAIANEIPLPSELKAKATVKRGEREGKWEKTLVVEFPQRRRVLSTNDGLLDAMAVVNHSAHPDIWSYVCQAMKTNHEIGGRVYMKMIRERIAQSLGLRSEDISLMATAADMDNMAATTKTFPPFVVVALVTAGAKSNALRTGVDEGTYLEPELTWEKLTIAKEVGPGTINVLLLTNARLTDAGLARAIITVTEAKTAALQDLRVPSTYTKNVQATGTGTDTAIIVSGTSGPLVTYPGGHSRIGELMGKAVYEAVVEALGKQNGFKLEK